MVDHHGKAYPSMGLFLRRLIFVFLLLVIAFPGKIAFSSSGDKRINFQDTFPYANYLPYLNRDSIVTVQNLENSNLTFRIRFYPSSGSPYIDYLSPTVPPLGSIRVVLSAILPTGTFSAVVSTSNPVAINASIQWAGAYPDSRDMYPAATSGANPLLFGPLYKGIHGTNSQLVLTNTGNGLTSGNIEIFDSVGVQTLIKPIPSLNPGVSFTFSVVDIPELTNGFIGYVKVAESSQPMTGLLIQVSDQSLRISGPLKRIQSEQDNAYPRLFKHYLEGTGYQTSKILLLNNGTDEAGTTIQYYQKDAVASDSPKISKGAMKDIDLPSTLLADNFTYSAKLGTLGMVYSAELRSDEARPNGSASHLDGIAILNGVAIPGISTFIPGTSFISVQNTGTTPADSSLSFYGLDGTLVHSLPITGLGGGLTQLFDLAKIPQLNNFTGSAVLAFTSPASFVAEMDAYTGPSLYLPLVAKNYNSASCIPAGSFSDPLFGSQLNLQLINAPQAWAECMAGSPDVTVAVLDTGVDPTHPDLKDNLVAGKSFYPSDSSTQDANGHGTHVAGIIAAGANNYGVLGVAPKSKILPVRVLDPNGSGYTSWAANGIIWAADRAQILSLSLGGTELDPALREAINYAYSKGRLVVSAVGNNGYNGVPVYPAAFDHVIGVGAVDNSKSHWYGSNAGNFVDLSAPGVNVLSTYPTYFGGYPKDFATMTGTSMATPHVSGLAALLWGFFPSATADQIFALMKSSAVDLGDKGWDATYGFGLINAHPAGGFSLSGLPAIAPMENGEVSTPATSAQRDDRMAAIAAGRVLMKFKEGVVRASSLELPGYTPQAIQLVDSIPGIGTQILSVPEGMEWQVVDQLRTDPNVEYAEPDYVLNLIQ